MISPLRYAAIPFGATPKNEPSQEGGDGQPPKPKVIGEQAGQTGKTDLDERFNKLVKVRVLKDIQDNPALFPFQENDDQD